MNYMPTINMKDLKILKTKGKKAAKKKILINAAGVGFRGRNSRNQSNIGMHKTIQNMRIISPMSNRGIKSPEIRNFKSPLQKTTFTRRRKMDKKISKILEIRSKLLSRNTKAEARLNSIKSSRKSPFSLRRNLA